jgi:opacity protein-like surface antigen
MRTRSTRISIVSLILLLAASSLFGQMRSGKLGVGVSGTGSLLQTDFSKNTMKYGGGLSLSYSLTEYIGLRSTFLFDQADFTDARSTPTVDYTVNMFSGNVYLSLDLMPNSSVNPFLLAGVGRAYYSTRNIGGTGPLTNAAFDIHLLMGGGFDIFLSEFLSVTVQGEYVMVGSDYYDGLKAGAVNDNMSRVSLQVRYYFFDQSFVTKLLEAMKHRYEGN